MPISSQINRVHTVQSNSCKIVSILYSCRSVDLTSCYPHVSEKNNLHSYSPYILHVRPIDLLNEITLIISAKEYNLKLPVYLLYSFFSPPLTSSSSGTYRPTTVYSDPLTRVLREKPRLTHKCSSGQGCSFGRIERCILRQQSGPQNIPH